MKDVFRKIFNWRRGGYRVTIRWDDEAKIYWAQSDDIPGLATEAETIDGLVQRILDVAPELLRANAKNYNSNNDIPLSITAEYQKLIHCT